MGTYTTNYNLFMPSVGEQGWGELVNGNFETIDTTMKEMDTRLTTCESTDVAYNTRLETLEAGEFETINVAGTVVADVGNFGRIVVPYNSNGVNIATSSGASKQSNVGGWNYAGTLSPPVLPAYLYVENAVCELTLSIVGTQSANGNMGGRLLDENDNVLGTITKGYSTSTYTIAISNVSPYKTYTLQTYVDPKVNGGTARVTASITGLYIKA